MAAVLPQTGPGALGGVLFASIVVASAAGLTLHAGFYAGTCRRDYWAYYTNLSNLAVFLYFTLAAPVLYASDALRPLIPHAEYALTMSILLTHVVYHNFIAPFLHLQTVYAQPAPDARIANADSAVQHYAVPLLTAAYWLFCSPGKAALGLADAFLWLLFPLSYVAFILVRARVRGVICGTGSAYPYPFLDVALLGAQRVAVLCAVLLLVCGGFSLLGIVFIRTLLCLFP